MKTKKWVLIALLLIVVVLVAFVCIYQPFGDKKDIKSDKDVAAAISDIGMDISNFTKELDSIDKSLG